MSHFVFNGVSSEAMGVRIEKYPDIPKPKKRMSQIVVPGRDDPLRQWDGTYEPVTVRYQCWFKSEGDPDSVANRAHQIAEWLGSAPAGAELSDTYDPLVYRRATYIGGADFRNIVNRYGKFDVVFECDPRCFLESGRDIGVEVGSPVVLSNVTTHLSKPVITVTCAGSGNVIFRQRQGETILKTYTIGIRYPDQLPHTATIDCDIEEAWGSVNGVIQSLNPWIYTDEFPVVAPGQVEIEVTGGITDARIDLRWWTL